MPCIGTWSFKAQDRRLRVVTMPTDDSPAPTFIELDVRIFDTQDKDAAEIDLGFSASELAEGIEIDLDPGRRHHLCLITSPPGVRLKTSITVLDDDTDLVDDQICTRAAAPIVSRWTVTTWKEEE